MGFNELVNYFNRIKNNQMARYIFFGGCTTAVNVILFYLLREVMTLPLFLSNFTSISMAILFAFIVNKRLVFESSDRKAGNIAREFLLFISMRLVSMVVEIAGVWFAVAVLLFSDIAGKLMLQAVVIAINFFFSKYIVFRKGSVSNHPVQG